MGDERVNVGIGLLSTFDRWFAKGSCRRRPFTWASNSKGARKNLMTSSCTFCRIVAGDLQPGLLSFEDEVVAAFPSHEQRPLNRGHLIVVPRQHRRNLYDTDDELLAKVMPRVRELAQVVHAAFDASGTTIRQNNERPGQDTFHLHFHVIPRFEGDEGLLPPVERIPDAELLEQAARIRAEIEERRTDGRWQFS